MSSGTSNSGRATHPSASTQTEAKLAIRHITYEFEPNLRVDEIRDAEGNQVRLTEHRAPKETVERYAQQMKGGATFPAIVVNSQFEIVDGNTRWMAAKRNRRETIPAYVCQNLSALDARSLSVELNQSNGLAMTQDELHAFVTGAVAEGQTLDAKAYARMTGVKPSTLQRWVAAAQFEVRAAREHIPAERLDVLSATIRAALNVAKLSAVFISVTDLAIDARVPISQLKAIITEANAASSEAAACRIIARERDARTDDIRRIAAGFKTKRKGTTSALHIGGLLGYDVSDLLDVAPEKRAETFERLTQVRDLFNGAIAKASEDWGITEDDSAEPDATPAFAQAV